MINPLAFRDTVLLTKKMNLAQVFTSIPQPRYLIRLLDFFSPIVSLLLLFFFCLGVSLGLAHKLTIVIALVLTFQILSRGVLGLVRVNFLRGASQQISGKTVEILVILKIFSPARWRASML